MKNATLWYELHFVTNEVPHIGYDLKFGILIDESSSTEAEEADKRAAEIVTKTIQQHLPFHRDEVIYSSRDRLGNRFRFDTESTKLINKLNNTPS